MNAEKRKVAVVTGASGNLGKAVVEKFISEDYAVIGTINKNDSLEIKNFETIEVDLTDEAATNEVIESVIKKYSSIDVAVLTVGGFAMGSIAETKTSDVLKQYKINFETAYNITRPSFMQMTKQESGSIFLIGSKPGLSMKNSKSMIAYGLSKSLLFRLAELLNDEAKEKNVKVFVVVPSIIDTPQNRKAMPNADFSKWQKPEAIADIIFKRVVNEKATAKDYIIEI